GCVHSCHMRSMGASKVRSITIASLEIVLSLIAFFLAVELLDIVVHAVKARLPYGTVLLCPVRNFFQGCSIDGAGAVLCFLPLSNQPRTLQYFDVLRNGGQAHVKRLCQFIDGRVSFR